MSGNLDGSFGSGWWWGGSVGKKVCVDAVVREEKRVGRDGPDLERVKLLLAK
jgi:hypothetical protein